eukprot:gene4300-5380_t
MSNHQSKLLKQSNFEWLSWIGSYQPHHKFHNSLISNLESTSKSTTSTTSSKYIILLSIPIEKQSIINDLYENWKKSIQSIINSHQSEKEVEEFSIEIITNNRLKLTISNQFSIGLKKLIINWISNQFETQWIEKEEKIEFHNKFAPSIIFSKTNGSLVKNDRVDIPLRGKGQIVGVADTGLDKDHCFFSDPSQPFPFNTINNNHRKVVSYYTYQDDIDEPNGHGTHVSGSVAGASASMDSPINQYAGVASDAKLAFYDLVKLGVANEPTPPSDLNIMYQKIYDSGARLHCDSWGSNSVQGKDSAYGQPSADIDKFIHDHPDFLIMRAAGNNGDYGFQTLLAQAVSKNALTIGAQFQDYFSFEQYLPYANDVESTVLQGIQNACLMNEKYCNYTTAQCCAEMNTVRGLSLCCNTWISNYLNESIYKQGPAELNPNNVASFSSRGPTLDGRVKPDVIAPGMMVVSSRSNGNSNVDQCGDGSLSKNSLMSLQGTSMATPLATGAIAILRQYLMEGYYPTGAPVEDHQLKPSASLLKGLVINTANLVNGTYQIDKPKSPLNENMQVPTNKFSKANNDQNRVKHSSLVQGWGAMNLGNFLYFKKENDVDQPAITFLIGGLEDGQVKDWKEPSIIGTAKLKNYCVRYTSTSGNPAIKATLVWTDYPALSGSYYTLVNNLDLLLIVDNQNFTGNEANPSFQSKTSEPDRVNNVEQIFYSPKESGITMKFTVNGTSVPMGPQAYSFIFSGVNGKYEWAQCPQCISGALQTCPVANGIGTQHCGDDLQWGKCIVNVCNTGYNYNSLSNTCDQFLSYNYIVIIVAGATMILITLAIIVIKYLEKRDRERDERERDGLLAGNKKKPSGGGEGGASAAAPEKRPTVSSNTIVTIPDLYSIISPYIFTLLFATAASLVATAASILEPFYIGNIIQAIPTTHSIGSLKNDFIYIFLLAFIEFVFSTIGSWISGIVNERIIMRLQNRIFKSIMAQDIGFFQKNNVPTLMNVLIVDAPMLRSNLTGILVTIATSVCKFVGSLVFIFSISWKLSLAFFATVPILLTITQIQSIFAKRLTRVLLFYNSKASQHGTEAMINMHVVTNYCTQEKEIKKYNSSLLDVFITARNLMIVNTLAGSIKMLFIHSLAFIILYFGAYLAIRKEFSVGLLISFTLYVGYVCDASNALFGVYVSYIQSKATAQRVFLILRSAPRKRSTLEEEAMDKLENEQQQLLLQQQQNNDENNNNNNNNSSNNSIEMTNILQEDSNQSVGDSDQSVCDSNQELTEKDIKAAKKKEQKEFYKKTGISVIEMSSIPSTYIDLTDVKGDIEFKNVSFRYPTRPDVEVLHNISMKFEAGKCYGIVGPSGSGKSTALELISKFYQLKEGKILMDDTDITKIRPSNLRSFVTNVHQQPFLFDATIRENIGYALESPTMEDVINAAVLANAHEFILELPNQYETVLGAAGNLLSGGQKKRISVARAICAKRKIMLLDEITAELDPESEEAITNSIKKITQGHTVIMVAHKVAAIKDCDTIFVLEKGYLVEQGNHNELMAKRGKYYKMFDTSEDENIVIDNSGNNIIDPNNNLVNNNNENNNNNNNSNENNNNNFNTLDNNNLNTNDDGNNNNNNIDIQPNIDNNTDNINNNGNNLDTINDDANINNNNDENINNQENNNLNNNINNINAENNDENIVTPDTELPPVPSSSSSSSSSSST